MALYTELDNKILDDNITEIINRTDTKIKELFGDETTTREQKIQINTIILNFIKEKNRIIYGGYALNMFIKEKDPSDAIYMDDDEKIPDIDFYTPTPIDDLLYLCNLFHEKGFLKVQGKEALHKETYSMFINGDLYCDFSYMPENIFIKLPTLSVNNIKVIHPDFMGIDYLRMLTDPILSYWRLVDKNVLSRYVTILKHYPIDLTIKPLPHLHKMTFTNDVLKSINDIYKQYDSFILIGFAAYNQFAKIANSLDKYPIIDIPYYEFISTNYKQDIKSFIEQLHEKNKHKVKIVEHYPFFQLLGPSVHIYNGTDLVAIIYDHNKRCTPYIENLNKTKMGSFTVTLLYSEICKIYHMINSDNVKQDMYTSLSANLILMRQEYFKKNKKTIVSDTPFRDFITECIGSTMPLQKERELLIEERKKQNKPYLFKYEPAINKKITETSYQFSNSSGNPIKNPNNKKLKK